MKNLQVTMKVSAIVLEFCRLPREYDSMIPQTNILNYIVYRKGKHFIFHLTSYLPPKVV